MQPVSPQVVENTRKTAARIQADVLQRLAFVTQESVAERMGKSGSTVSRFVSEERLAFACEVLAACGLKVVETGTITTKPDELRMLKKMAVKYLMADLERTEGDEPNTDAS